ncbi:hypothetical protein Taro_026328 [Colocasia esculenta]|uniref:Uncharacterized protein n=1 Tax=Colocasia esculenta TaxID=4460 RepID=A0A843VQZ8_COLES|nr:hypothetical protein [Colocasia esculenta]
MELAIGDGLLPLALGYETAPQIIQHTGQRTSEFHLKDLGECGMIWSEIGCITSKLKTDFGFVEKLLEFLNQQQENNLDMERSE